MIEISGERWIEARCEQVWMVVDDANCRSRWLSFHEQIEEVVVHEPSRRLGWHTHDHPSLSRVDPNASVIVELIPDGSGTRVKLYATCQSTGRIKALTARITGQRACQREIEQSLDLLATLLTGRCVA